MHFIIFGAFLVLGLGSGDASSPAASPPAVCPLTIRYAGLAAIGSVHQSAEYSIEVKGDQPPSSAPYSIDLTVGTGTDATFPLTIDSLSLDQRKGWANGTATMIAVLPTNDVQWIRIDRVTGGSSGSIECSALTPYAVDGPKQTATPSFDDSASWISLGKPTLVQLIGPATTTQTSPIYSTAAQTTNSEGDVDIQMTIGEDGTATGVTLLHSSAGSSLDSASLDAVRQEVFSPARLSAALGGGFVSVNWDVKFAFRLVRVGVTIGPTGILEKTWLMSPSRDVQANDAALQATKQSHFATPTFNGVPATKDFQITYAFVAVR